MRFFCIDDGVPEATVRLLRQACDRRGIPFVHVHATSFDFAESSRPAPGDMVYRPAVSVAAQRTEQWMVGPGVATFRARPEDVHFPPANPGILFESVGLPVPRSFHCHGADRTLLLARAEACGGFPVVLKIPGHSRGIGVMRADSAESLVSLVDFALAAGRTPILMPFIADAIHWRVVVVGDRAVAAYRNPVDKHDFRTYGSTDPADFTARVAPALEELAVASVAVQRLELGGVDILEHASGRLYLLEANFPLYHAHAEEIAGIDVSGAMVEHLARKAGHAARIAQLPAAAPLSHAPRLHRIDGFASPEELRRVLALAGDREWLARHGVTTRQDSTGASCELPVAADPTLRVLAERMQHVVGMRNAFDRTLRYRRYEVGEAHPPHGDFYAIDGMELAATALLYLTDAEGGATRFGAARPAPVDVQPVAGRLAWWHNLDESGARDPTAVHEALPVESGVKAVLAQFFYSPRESSGGVSR